MHKHLITEDNVLSYNKHGEKGYKRVYVRLGAKEYNIILQLKYNTRYTTSYMLTEAINEVLGKILYLHFVPRLSPWSSRHFYIEKI